MASSSDALIISGGPAGLTAALTLARQQQSSIIFDSGSYRNDLADYMHLIPGLDHIKLLEFRDKAKDNILSNYDQVQFKKTAVSSVQKDESNVCFSLTDETGNVWSGKKLILRNGVEGIYPNIDGYAGCWGKGIFHCLFCKGYEERGCTSAGVLAVGGLSKPPLALHVARQISTLSQTVTIYPKRVGAAGLTARR